MSKTVRFRATVLGSALLLVVGCSGNVPSSAVAPVVKPQVEVEPPKKEDKERLLLNSIMHGHEIQFRQLLKEGVDVNCVFPGSHGKFSPAAAALVYRRPSMFEALLRAGASPYSRYQGYSLIDLATHRFGAGSSEVGLLQAAMSLKLSPKEGM